MTYPEDVLLRLIDRIYEAALSPELWPEFLEALAEATDGHVVNLAHSDIRGDQITVGATARFDPNALRLYHEHYATKDPWLKSAAQRGLIRAGALGLGSALVPTRELHRTEFYNEFGRDGGFDGGISIMIRMDEHGATALSVTQRGRGFGEPELQLARRLLPHLQRAFQVHERLTGIAHQRSAAEDVIDRLPFGVVLVDASGAAVFVNHAAEQILDRRDGLILRNKALYVANPAQMSQLCALISGVVAASQSGGLGSGGALAIGRPSGRRPFQVLVTRLGTRLGRVTVGPANACAAVFVSDPDLQPLTAEAVLRQVFGLTPAETRFGVHLLRHTSVKAAADSLGISMSTARTHLRRLFEKTGTRQQSDLVRVFLNGVGQLRF